MAAHGRGKGLTLIFHPLRNCKLQFTTCKANLLKLFPDSQRTSERREVYRARGQKTDTAQTCEQAAKEQDPEKVMELMEEFHRPKGAFATLEDSGADSSLLSSQMLYG